VALINLILFSLSIVIRNGELGLYVMQRAVKNSFKILTIEDDPSQTEALKEALIVAQIICVEIHEAEDGDQAMAFLHQEYPHMDAPQPDLIFLSNHLPDRTGNEIIKEIQQDRRLRTIPIALFSEQDPSASKNVTFPDNCHLFMRPKTCDEWIYVLRCIEDVWITLLNMTGAPNV
jgi:CheY-like chemotaxis protein